jgi:hypothetical protein
MPRGRPPSLWCRAQPLFEIPRLCGPLARLFGGFDAYNLTPLTTAGGSPGSVKRLCIEGKAFPLVRSATAKGAKVDATRRATQSAHCGALTPRARPRASCPRVRQIARGDSRAIPC